MSGEGWISMTRWSDFQTYDTGRNNSGRPPWIKLYTRLLDDDDYLELSPHQALLLHRLWLAYASSGCELRASPARLGRKLGLWSGQSGDNPGRSGVRRRDLEALEKAGFLTIVERKTDAEGARPAQALARPREEVEEEREKTSAEQSRSKTTEAARPSEDEDEPEWAGEAEPPPEQDEPQRWMGSTDVPRLEPIAELERLVERWGS